MKISNWYSIDVCVNCEHELSRAELGYSNGTCPYCGHTDNSTICSYKKVTLRKIKHYKWWQVFGRKVTYEGKDDFSKQWLRNKLCKRI